MRTKTYPTDVTDEQWQSIAPLLPKPKPGGRPRSVDLRDVLNGVLYVVRGGVPWRMLPHDLRKSPSAAIVDTQAVCTTSGGEKGYDAGKRTPGRKRHIIVDTMGLLLAVVVHSATVQDRDGVKRVGERIEGNSPGRG